MTIHGASLKGGGGGCQGFSENDVELVTRQKTHTAYTVYFYFGAQRTITTLQLNMYTV